MSRPAKKFWRPSTIGLFLAIVVLFLGSLYLAPKPIGDAEAFGGTDAKVTETLEAEGKKPWFTPIFQPGSGEIESGLFALQAAVGAGVLGFALGRLAKRRAESDDVLSDEHAA